MEPKALMPSESLYNQYNRQLELAEIYQDILVVLQSMTVDRCFTVEDVFSHLQELANKVSRAIAPVEHRKVSA